MRRAGHGRGVASAVAHSGRMTQPELKRTARTRNRPESDRVLDRGWELVSSVPYKVGARWLFYGLMQEGFYRTKKDYKNRFIPIFARARLSFHKEWRPDTLEDDVRHIIERSGGYESADAAVNDVRQNILDAALISIDHFYRQENYVELWFEANAMSSQFKYYTRGIDLIPMGGTASIPYKWKMAKRLEAAADRYGKPIIILYFGDEDEAGHKIQEVIERDVSGWCSEPFKVVWCGLTMDQVRKYHIPENFEKKGYQWEALPDEGAKEIITTAMEKYVDPDLINEVDEEAEEFAKEWEAKLEAVLDKFEQEKT